MKFFNTTLLFFLLLITSFNNLKSQNEYKYDVTNIENFEKDEVIHSSKKIGDNYFLLTSHNKVNTFSTTETYYLKKYTSEMKYIKQVKLPFTNVKLRWFSKKNGQIIIYYLERIKKESVFRSQSISVFDLKIGNNNEEDVIKYTYVKKKKVLLRSTWKDKEGKTVNIYVVYDKINQIEKILKKTFDSEGSLILIDSVLLKGVFNNAKIAYNVFIKKIDNDNIQIAGKVNYNNSNTWGGFIISLNNLLKIKYSFNYPVSSTLLMKGQSNKLKRNFIKFYDSPNGRKSRTRGSVIVHCAYSPFNFVKGKKGGSYLMFKSKIAHSGYNTVNGFSIPYETHTEYGTIIFSFDENGKLLWKSNVAKNHNVTNKVVRAVSFRNDLYAGTYEAFYKKNFYSIYNDNSKNQDSSKVIKNFKGDSPYSSSLFLTKINPNGIQTKMKIIDNSELKGMCQVNSYIKLNDNKVLFFVKTGRTITKKLIVTLI